MTTARRHVTHRDDCPVDGWGAMTWQTLFSAERTPTAAITQGIALIGAAPPEALVLHRHAHAESYYVLAGHGVLEIDGEEFALAPGVAAFIPGGSLHAVRSTGAEKLQILYTFATDSFDEVVYEFPVTDPR